MDKGLDLTRRKFMKQSALASAGVLVTGTQAANALQKGQSAQASAEKSENYHTVENEFIRIRVNSDNGAITSLFNKRSGKEYITAPQQTRSFRLVVPDRYRVTGYNADWSANALDSWEQTNCTISNQRISGSKIMTLRYPELESAAGKFPIEVQYSIRLADNSEDLVLQLNVFNHSRFYINEVFFPWVSGVGAVDGIEIDNFVAPNMIRSIPDLRQAYDHKSNWEEYPYLLGVPQWPSGYSLSMPWMNYGGRSEGLYLASRSREGIRHMLMIQDFGAPGDPILAFAWAFVPYIGPGKSWQTPEIVLSLHAGDWHAAADKYRTSLHDWYRKPNLMPDSKKTFASYNSFFTSCDFMQIAVLAKDIKRYGLNDLVMWNFGDYYPNVTEEDDLTVDPPRLGEFTSQWGGLSRLQKANGVAEALGVRTGIIFSQRLWNKSTLTPDMQKLAERWVIRTAAGDPITESWTHEHLGALQWSHNEPYFGYVEYVMCSAVKEYQEFAIQNIVGVLDKGGYSAMFFDQAVESLLCFSKEHSHSTVSAPSLASHAFLESLTKVMKERNSDWRLVGEGWELLASQTMDMGWVWFGESNAEVFRYTLPWARVARAVDIDLGDANRHFVLGVHLAIIPKGIESGKKLSDFPEFAQHISSLADFRKKTERFWIDGVFADNVGLKIAGAFGKVYKTPDEVAVMIANLTNQPSTVNFELDSVRYTIEGMSFSVVSSSMHSGRGSAERLDGTLKGNMTLSSYEVVAVVFRRQAQHT